MKRFFVFVAVLFVFVAATYSVQADGPRRIPTENYIAAANALSGSITSAKLRAVAEGFSETISLFAPKEAHLTHWYATAFGFEMRSYSTATWSESGRDWGVAKIFWDGSVEFSIGPGAKGVVRKNLGDF